MKRVLLLLALSLIVPSLLLAKRNCSCGPLNAHHFSAMFKGSLDFTYYTDREDVWVTEPTGVFSAGKTPKFNQQFDIPWNVGVELAWNPTACIQFFLEYAYTFAGGKRALFEETASGPIQEFYADYDAHAGYLGARYYLKGWSIPCFGLLVPYGGFKTGFVVLPDVVYELRENSGSLLARTNYWQSQVVPSGALQFGLEWWFNPCLSFVLQGEFIGTCGPRPNRNVVVDPVNSFTNINLGGTGWLITWPITLGMRYTF